MNQYLKTNLSAEDEGAYLFRFARALRNIFAIRSVCRAMAFRPSSGLVRVRGSLPPATWPRAILTMYSASRAAQAASGIHISLQAEDLTQRPACIIIASDIMCRGLADSYRPILSVVFYGHTRPVGFCRPTPSAIEYCSWGQPIVNRQ